MSLTGVQPWDFAPGFLMKKISRDSAATISILLAAVVFLQGIAFSQEEKPSPVNQDLFHAAYALNADEVRKALDNGADPNTPDKHGRTALIIASGNTLNYSYSPQASEEIVRLLLSKGANPNVVTGDDVGIGATALLGAIEFGQHDIAKLLLDKGANPNLADERGRTPLCMAAYRQNIQLINLLLERGVDPNASSHSVCHPLRSCMDRLNSADDDARAKKCLSRLLDARADPDRPGALLTPLGIAAWRGKLELVQLLLDRGARADAEGTDGSTPLMWAAGIDIKKALVARGADVNHKDDAGRTTLMRSAQEGIVFLLQNGARLNDVDSEGLSAIAHAASRADPQIVKTLLEYRPNLSLKTKSGDNLLHLVFRQPTSCFCDSKIRETAELLIKAGVKVSEKNNRAELPIHLAADWGSPSGIQLLVRNGAGLGAKDDEGKTPLDRARQFLQNDAALLIHDLVTAKAGTSANKPPPSFWNQFAVPVLNGHPFLASADPDPIRQAGLEDLATDLLDLGFTNSDGNLLSFWQQLPNEKRNDLLHKHSKVFNSYEPLLAFMPDRQYRLQDEALNAAYRWARRQADEKQPQSMPNQTSEQALRDLDLSGGPLSALSIAHLASAFPESLGKRPSELKRGAVRSFLFGTYRQLYPSRKGSEKAVTFDEAVKYFGPRVRIIGADLLRLYRAQRPFLANVFKRPMIPVNVTFKLSRTDTFADESGKRRYASLSYDDIVDSFHACIIEEMQPFVEADEDTDDDDDKSLAVFSATMPDEAKIPGSFRSSTDNDSSSITREEALDELADINDRLLHSKPLSLTALAAQSSMGKWLADFLRALATVRPQKKDAPVFMKPFEERAKALDRQCNENEEKCEHDMALMKKWLTDFALNASLYDAARKVERQFNNVLQFALAHELGHHVFGTTDVHDVKAEDDADAFAVTLLTTAYTHLSLTELSLLDQKGRKTGGKLVVLDGNALRKYLGYPVYFGSRLKQRTNHSPLYSNHRRPADRLKFLTEQFRSSYHLLQTRIFVQRVRAYRSRKVSRNILDEFTSVVRVMEERR